MMEKLGNFSNKPNKPPFQLTSNKWVTLLPTHMSRLQCVLSENCQKEMAVELKSVHFWSYVDKA